MFNACYQCRVGFVFGNVFQKHIFIRRYLSFVELFYLFRKDIENIKIF